MTDRSGRPHHRYYLSDTKPISLNNAMIPVSGRRWVRTKESSEYKGDFMRQARAQDPIPDYTYYETSYIYLMPHAEMFFKNGKLRRRDVSNYIKLLEDGLMAVFQQDDSQVFTLHGTKRISPDGRFHCIVIVTEASIDDPVYHGQNPVIYEISGGKIETTLVPV